MSQLVNEHMHTFDLQPCHQSYSGTLFYHVVLWCIYYVSSYSKIQLLSVSFVLSWVMIELKRLSVTDELELT